MGRQDLKLEPRNGQFPVVLADGRTVTMDAVDIAYMLHDAYAYAELPGSPATGQVARVTDQNNVLFFYTGAVWAPVTTLPAFATASLPAAALAGRLARVTDGIRGIRMDTGSAWRHLFGEVIDAKRDFGCVGDGATNETTAVSTALAAAVAANAPLYFPPDTYNIRSTPSATSCHPVILGAGARATTFHWKGTDSTAMFELTDAGDGTLFRGFGITATVSNPLGTAIRLLNGSGATVTPRKRRFEDLYIEGTSGRITKGFHWDPSGGGGDNNNDSDLLVNVWVANYAGAAYHIDGTQSFSINFDNCFATSGQYGVHADSGFHWRGGHLSGNTGADFFIENPTASTTTTIVGADSELSARLITTGGPTPVSMKCTMIGVRGITTAAFLAADKKYVDFKFPSLVMIGCELGDISLTEAVEMFVSPQDNVTGVGVAIGCSIYSTLALPFTGKRWQLFGNSRVDDTGAASGITALVTSRSVTNFADEDLTPSVANGNVFRTANHTAPRTITAFDDVIEGQEITVLVADGNTTFDFTGTTLTGNAGVNWTPAQGDHMTCVFDSTNWRCRISDNTA